MTSYEVMLYCNVLKFDGMPCDIAKETTLQTRNPHNLIHTKSSLKNIPKPLQKRPKTNPKDHQNGPKIALFDARGAHWTPRVKNVSKMTPNSWPRVPQGDPFSVRNRPWKSKKTLKTEKNTSLTKRFENVTKKCRNRILRNLKKYDFV